MGNYLNLPLLIDEAPLDGETDEDIARYKEIKSRLSAASEDEINFVQERINKIEEENLRRMSEITN